MQSHFDDPQCENKHPEHLCLQNHFLIAMPALQQDIFYRAVVYVCAHSDDGAMGIIVNHPIMEVKISEVLEQMNIPLKNPHHGEQPVLLGGPVSPERGFIIHRPNNGEWQATLLTSDDVGVTSSKDILQALGEGKGPSDIVVALGYAGWDPGQLEEELLKNYWLSVEADPKIIFDIPFHRRWRQAAASLGVDITQIQSDAGHA